MEGTCDEIFPWGGPLWRRDGGILEDGNDPKLFERKSLPRESAVKRCDIIIQKKKYWKQN